MGRTVNCGNAVFKTTPVPEPGTLGLLVAAAVAGIVIRHKRKK